ncbi:MAG: type II toxin-antitoxin system RelE/ParE family toxin [Leptolyngbya sp. BL-A-14]
MSRYTIYITPETFQSIKNLPGSIRQRIKPAIQNFAEEPRPSQSKQLNLPDFEQELWRLRLDSWRIIYVISQADKVIDVLAVRKRPPYDYGDLQTLLEQLEE